MKGVQKNKEYSLMEIVALGVMGRHSMTVGRKVLEDKYSRDLLKADIGGTTGAKRYKILGANLLTYLRAHK